MTIHEAVKEARTRAGMTQKELAAEIGKGFQHVGRWERGERTPASETISIIEEATGYAIFPHAGEWEVIPAVVIHEMLKSKNNSENT